MAQPATKKEYLFKILVVGDLGTGKTSIVKRYVHDVFTGNYKSTIAVDFALKVLQMGEATVRLQLWDIAGQERYGNMTRVYYKEALGALIVCDVAKAASDPAALEGVRKWKADMDGKVLQTVYDSNVEEPLTDQPIPCILLANKSDALTADDKLNLEEFCHETAIQKHFLTSAKEGAGIEEAIGYLVDLIIKQEQQHEAHLAKYGPTKAELEKKNKHRNLVSVGDRGSSSGRKGCC